MTEATTVTYLDLLRHRDFTRLWASQIISLFGDALTAVALTLLVYDLTQSPMALSVVFAVRVVPWVIIVPFSGVVADRVYRKRLLIGADLARAGLVALLPLVSQVWQLYFLVFTTATVGTLFEPAYEATLPEVVGQERYVKAVALARMSLWVGEIAGPGLAAGLVAWLGVRPIFWVDAATFLASAALIASAFIPRQRPSAIPTSPRQFLADTRAGFGFIADQPALHLLVYLSLVMAIPGAVTLVDTVVYVQGVLGQSEQVFAVVMAVFATGSVLGALLAGRLAGSRWRRWLMIGGAMGGGLTLIPVLFYPNVRLFASLCFLSGISLNLRLTPQQAYLAELTPNEVRGRVMAAMIAIAHLAWLFLYLAVGRITDPLGVNTVFALGGVSVVTCVVLFIFTPGFHTLKAHDARAVGYQQGY